MIIDTAIKIFEGAKITPADTWTQEHVPVIGSKLGVDKYKIDGYAEYVRRPLMDLQPDSPMQTVNFVAGIGAGKSEMSSAILQRNIKLGRTTLLVNDTENMLRKFLDSRLMPSLKANEDIKHLLPPAREKRIMKDKIVLDNCTLYTASCTMSQLQAVSVDMVIQDEIWLQGDDAEMFLKYAKGRGHDRPSFKHYNCSQASLANSPWHLHAMKANVYRYTAKCEECGEHMPYEWENFKWEKKHDEQGNIDLDATADTVKFVCPECGHAHDDDHHTRSRLSAKGEYVLESEGMRNEATYFVPAMAFRGTTWRSLVIQYMEALQRFRDTDNASLLEIFDTQRLVKFHIPPNNDVTMGDDPEEPYKLSDVQPENWRAFVENRGEWVGNYMGVDCQKGHYYVVVRAHFMDGTRCLLHHSMVEDSDEGMGEGLMKIADQYDVKNHRVAIDGSYKPAASAKLSKSFQVNRQGQDAVVKVFGAKIPNAPIIFRGHTGSTDQTWQINVTRSSKRPLMRRFNHSDFLPLQSGRHHVLEIRHQNLFYKDEVRAMMTNADFFAIPVDEEMAEYVKHMTTEIWTRQKTGKYKYEKPYNSARVDYWDCEVMIAILAEMHNVPNPMSVENV